jgi:hypothetical protein
MTSSNLTPEQQKLRDRWERHMMCEFATHDTEETLATMVPDAYVNHIPILTGGVGLFCRYEIPHHAEKLSRDIAQNTSLSGNSPFRRDPYCRT